MHVRKGKRKKLSIKILKNNIFIDKKSRISQNTERVTGVNQLWE